MGSDSAEFTHRMPPPPPKAHLPDRKSDLDTIVNVFTEVQAQVDAGADMVVLPEHYSRYKLEPIRFICENNLNFFQGNLIKYILRYDAKNGLEDLEKAQRYLTMFILFVKGDPDWWKAR